MPAETLKLFEVQMFFHRGDRGGGGGGIVGLIFC